MNTKHISNNINSNLNLKTNRDIINSLDLPPVNTLPNKFVTPAYTTINYKGRSIANERTKIMNTYTKYHNTLINSNSQEYAKYEINVPKQVPNPKITYNFLTKNINHNTAARFKNANELKNTKDGTAFRKFIYTKTHKTVIGKDNSGKLNKDIENEDIYKDELGKMNNAKVLTNNSQPNISNTQRNNKMRKYGAINNLVDVIIHNINIMLNNITVNGTNGGQQNKTLCELNF